MSETQKTKESKSTKSSAKAVESIKDVSKEKTKPNEVGVAPENALPILGAFSVRAKSDQGFWRSGIQFHRQQEKLVIAVDVSGPIEDNGFIDANGFDVDDTVMLDKASAERVYHEPNLIVTDVDLSELVGVEGNKGA